MRWLWGRPRQMAILLKAKLPIEITSLPIAHLQMKPRVNQEMGIRTIGDLLTLVASADQAPLGWSLTVRRDVNLVLGALSKSISDLGVFNWEKFRGSTTTNPSSSSLTCLYFASPILDRLSKSAARKPLGGLHLSNRTINHLHSEGIRTIGTLVVQARVGLQTGQADLTRRELHSALQALAGSIGSDGNICLITYADLRGFTILPSKNRRTWSGQQFAAAFGRVALKAVRLRYDDIGVAIFSSRLLAPYCNRLTCGNLAKRFLISRQRVSMIEQDILRMFRDICWHENYTGCEFRFHAEFFRPLQRILVAINRKPSGLFSDDDWQNIVHALGVLKPAQLEREKRLIFAILGLRLISAERESVLPMLATPTKSSRAVRRARWTTKEILMNGFPNGLTGPELQAEIQKKLGSLTPALKELPAIVHSIPSVEFYRETRRYRARAGFLIYGGDEYERVLRASGKPMHYSDIVLKAAAGTLRGKRATKTVLDQLSRDPRFTYIGHTGIWGLSEWKHIETRTIADIAAQLLTDAGQPMTEEELFHLISSRGRPVIKRSLRQLFTQDRRFQKIGPAKWNLATLHDRDGLGIP